MNRLPNNNLYTPSSLSREVKVHEKKLRTLDTLETAIQAFEACISDAYTICPFGHDSLAVQATVAGGISFANAYLAEINAIRNQATLEHMNAMEILQELEPVCSEDENQQDMFSGLKVTEDDVAIAKSLLTEELEDSRNFRKRDNARSAAFEEQLEDLTRAYMLSDNNDNSISTGNTYK